MIGNVVTTVTPGLTGTATVTKTRYFHADHLGSLTAVTDAAGAVIERLSYDAWGKRRHPKSGGDDTCSNLGGESSEHGFTLHEHLDNVDLVHMNGRIYDPLIGRFLSADPNVFYPGNMQDFNRYAYVHNNPLSYTDPSGFMWDCDDACMSNTGTTVLPHTIALPIYINNGVASFNPSGGSYYGISITISYANSVGVSTSSSTSAASNQHGGAGVGTIGTGANSGDAVRSGSAVGNVFGDYVPLVGGMLGGLADMGSGIVNMGLGVATLGLSNSFGRGLDQFGYGLGMEANILTRDVAMGAAGIAGTVFTTGMGIADMATLGNVRSNGNPFLAVGIFTLDAAILDLGAFDGSSWGLDQSRKESMAINVVDRNSYIHDRDYGQRVPYANTAWVLNNFSRVPAGLVAAGPLSAAYVLLGSLVFLPADFISGLFRGSP